MKYLPTINLYLGLINAVFVFSSLMFGHYANALLNLFASFVCIKYYLDSNSTYN